MKDMEFSDIDFVQIVVFVEFVIQATLTLFCKPSLYFSIQNRKDLVNNKNIFKYFNSRIFKMKSLYLKLPHGSQLNGIIGLQVLQLSFRTRNSQGNFFQMVLPIEATILVNVARFSIYLFRFSRIDTKQTTKLCFPKVILFNNYEKMTGVISKFCYNEKLTPKQKFDIEELLPLYYH